MYFMNENLIAVIQISLKFVSKGPINDILVLIQIMAWCRPGDKPSSEPTLTQFIDAYMGHKGEMS